MAAWYDGRLCSFDLETTSVDTEEARIVTAALVEAGDGRELDAITWLADPGVEIPTGASDIHGVTTEIARRDGVPAAEVIPAVRMMVDMATSVGRPLVIYNARYDLTVLDRECRRHGVEPLDLAGVHVIDPLVIDKWADQFRRGSRKLSAVCEHYGVELGDDAHDAGADALAVARLAWRMMHKPDLVQGRYPEIVTKRATWKRVREDIESLQGHQVAWARNQATGLRDYFTRQGKHEEAASVREDWPLVPLQEVTDGRVG